jgi:hypothetical protein
VAGGPRLDPLAAWSQSLRRLRSLAGAVADPADAVRQLQELQEDLVRGVFLPVDTMVQVARAIAEPLREQADAFQRASAAFADIATLLRREADLLEGAGDVVEAPADAVKSVLGASRAAKRGGRSSPPRD